MNFHQAVCPGEGQSVEGCAQLIAKSKPHAAFSAFTRNLIGHWMYFLHTIEGITPLLQSIEDSIRQHFLLALTRQDGVSDLECELFSLPDSP